MSKNSDYSCTRLMCPTCRTAHEAEHIEKHGEAFWRSRCPQQGERNIRMSSDAALFAKFRNDAPPMSDDIARKFTLCVLPITEHCSLQCPICFADADTKGWRITLDDLRTRAKRIQRENPGLVALSGGEPTEHENILEIVRILSL